MPRIVARIVQQPLVSIILDYVGYVFPVALFARSMLNAGLHSEHGSQETVLVAPTGWTRMVVLQFVHVGFVHVELMWFHVSKPTSQLSAVQSVYVVLSAGVLANSGRGSGAQPKPSPSAPV